MDNAKLNPLRQLSLDQLRTRTSEKWRAYAPDVLPLFVAEMDVPLAEPVVRAVTDAMGRGDTGYPVGLAYAEAFAEFAHERWNWGELLPERTHVVPDVMLGLTELLQLVTEPGSSIVVNNPVYPPFYWFIEHAGRRVVEAPLGADSRLDLDVLNETFARLTDDRKQVAYLLCNPQNPTGTVHTRAELAAVAELAEQHGVRVIADEIHAPLVLPGADFVPYLSVPGSSHGFSLMSASKGWNLAGLKSALAIAGPGSAAELATVEHHVSDGASHVGVIAHTAAITDGGDWLDSLLAGLDDNRRLLGELLSQHLPAIGYRPPAATFLSWLDCRNLALAEDPAKVFLDRGRVALNSGPDFGTGGEGHVRLNFGTHPDIIAEAISRMATAVS
jgi:cystathionine beta-lyase